MAATWKFNELQPRDKTREAVQGEFFAITAIRDEAEALVRESIQNSLDASTGGSVRVRIFVSGTEAGALSASKAGRWLKGGWKHFRANGNGLRDCPKQTDACPFLVIEDFGTTGLEGDPLVHFVPTGEFNPFYFFFRAEGRSGKSETDRGRWGVGKFVFPRSSRLRTFFALSVRASDSEPVLMGQAILKSHEVDGTPFHPDGWYGEERENGLVGPLTDDETRIRLSADFEIQRTKEPGLSIVIPYCAEGMDRSSFVAATIRSYFYPILTGSLVVDIDEPGDSLTLDAHTLPIVVDSIPKLKEEMAGVIELSTRLCSGTAEPGITLHMPQPGGALRWSSDLIEDEAAASLREQLESGEPVAVRVPLKVRPKNSEARDSYFDVYLKRDEFAIERPVFIREGIIISDVRAPRCRGYRAMVVVDDKPIATLLGDAENPSHTQWQSDSSNFKGRYLYGPSYIRFVTNSVSSLLQSIHEQDEAVDATALLDVFYLPASEMDPSGSPSKKKQAGKKKGVDTPENDTEIDIPPPPQKRYRLTRSTGGFTITNGDPQAKRPPVIDIRIAYDRRRGNALKNYSTDDFRLGYQPIEVTPPPVGLKILEQKDNRLRVQPLRDEFSLSVRGFDERRDLLVDVRVRDSEDG